MHIGLDISVLRIAQAGVLVYTRNLIEHLVELGADQRWTLLDVLPLNRDRPMPDGLRAFDAPNVRVVRCLGLNRSYLSMRPIARSGPLHALASRLDRALDRPWAYAATAAVGVQLRAALRGVDVFHSSDQFCYAPPGAAAVVTIHDLTSLAYPEFHLDATNAMHAAKERFAVERADRIIAVSEATKREIVARLGIPAERISVVYEAADARFHPYPPEQVQPVLDRYGLQAGAYILSVGTIEPRKNYARLVEAYARLRAQLAAPPPLVIAGGFGWLYEEILAAPARAGVEGHVRFLGKVPDAELPLLIAGAQLFVYPSLYEGFGLPVLEALACGVPVVASNSSSLPEVLGDAGLYCDPLEAASIAQRMAHVLGDPALAGRLRQAGPQRAARFSWRRMAQETLEVYAQASADRRARRRGKGGGPRV